MATLRPTGDSMSRIDTMLNTPIQTDNAILNEVIGWFVNILFFFLGTLRTIQREMELRFEALDKDDDSVDIFSTTKQPAAPATTTELTTSATARPRRQRCAKCHARGHDESECRTQDPAASRRRVAINQRKHKQARPPIVTYPSPIDPRFVSYVPPSHLAVNHQLDNPLQSMIAESTEFRRRQNQSAQDKRRARRSAARTS